MSNFLKTKIANETWNKKYRYKGETQLQTFERIANNLANNEKNSNEYKDKFLKTLLKFEDSDPVGIKCCPAGRIIANIGTNYKNATLANCFINGPVKNAKIEYKRKSSKMDISFDVKMKTPDDSDDLINIFLTIMEQAKTLASEGGYGINFSWCRPRGALIKGTGIEHPGVIAYMEVWNSVAECIVRGNRDGYVDKLKNYLTDEEYKKIENTIKKQARKGAQLGALDVNHPDIEEFIRVKQEMGKLNKFNLSVVIDDKFVNAVINNEMYDLTFKGKVYKRVKAKKLYDLIMKSTYNRAEPGVIFKDNANKCNPIEYMSDINCMNPCIVRGTLVSTKNGLKRVEDIKENEEIQTTMGYGKVKEIKKYENEKIYRVYFGDGFHQDVTSGHIFHLMKTDSRKKWSNNIRLTDINESDKYFVRKQWYNNYPKLANFSRDIGLFLGLYF